MKIYTCLIALSLFFALSQAGLAETITGDDVDSTVSFAPGEEGQSSDFVDTDISASITDAEPVSEEYTSGESFFSWVEQPLPRAPNVIKLSQSSYFVNVYGEQNVKFQIIYSDMYNTPISSGYPKVSYWGSQSSTTTLTLDLASNTTSGLLYSREAVISTGTYFYRYCIKNTEMPQECELSTNFFVVTMRPKNVVNAGLTNNSYTSNARVVLTWSAEYFETGALTYKLYFGTTPGNLNEIYHGSSTMYELTALDYNQTYYWKVEAINPSNVSSFSPVYSFITIKKSNSAFNCPNPFNPAAGQSTKIVFDMAQAGSAELKIYSELGGLCWSSNVNNLNAGENEVAYDGRDDNGRMMYNGTYPCVIIKKYPGRTEKDFCRILIIK